MDIRHLTEIMPPCNKTDGKFCGNEASSNRNFGARNICLKIHHAKIYHATL